MPAEHARGSQRGFEIVRGVEHHFDHALDMTVGGRLRPDLQAEASRDLGPDVVLVEHVAFDLRST